MKLHFFAVLVLTLNAGARAAEPLARGVSTNALAGTNSLQIWCQNGVLYTTNQVIFRQNVRAVDPQMYLECELLTAWFKPKTTNAPKPAPTDSGATADAGDIDLVIAETNVMIITAEMQIIGDRAVYNAADDILTMTGQLVVALNTQGSFAGTNIVYNRRSGEISGDGPITTIFNASLTRSNAPPPGLKPK